MLLIDFLTNAFNKLYINADENGWVKFNSKDSRTFPPKYDKYFIMRKDGKVHWETWNGTYWAYNGDVITHWKIIKLPKK